MVFKLKLLSYYKTSEDIQETFAKKKKRSTKPIYKYNVREDNQAAEMKKHVAMENLLCLIAHGSHAQGRFSWFFP